MATHFVAVRATESALDELEPLSRANPYLTRAVFASYRTAGYETWILSERDDAHALLHACCGLLRKGRLSCSMEIPSLPLIDADSAFWPGLLQFCRQHRVGHLEVDTYGSPAGVSIPQFDPRAVLRQRREYVLDLRAGASRKLSSNHQRNVKRGVKAGLVIQRSRSAEHATEHRALRNLSMERRLSRGEHVALVGPSRDDMAFLESGAGELFRAVKDGAVHSSVLVLLAPESAYYQSAGTSPEGMAVGASHFLINGIANELAAAGMQQFNLGGADSESSLARFKDGFGAYHVPLVAAIVDLSPAWLRLARSLSRAVRNPRALASVVRMKVYAAPPSSFAPVSAREDLQLRALSSDDIRNLSAGDTEFRRRQLDRLERFGESFAYAVEAGGEIAHIAWLLPATAIARDEPHVLRPTSAEMEITACETLPAFRRQGMYGYAIQQLMTIAGSQGTKRVFMKTIADNVDSQHVIERAGLEEIGTAMIVRAPLPRRPIILRMFR